MFINALKSELFRASKMKSIYILAIVLIALMLLNNFIYLKVDLYGLLGMDADAITELQEMGTSGEAYNDSFMAGFDAGLQSGELAAQDAMENGIEPIKILGKGVFYEADVAELTSLDIGSLDVLLLQAIFIGLYIGGVYKSELDKNIVKYSNKRGTLFAARTTVIALYTLILQLIVWVMAIWGMATMGQSLVLGFDSSFVIYSVVIYLLTVAFGILVAAITHLSKSMAGGITTGIILSSGILSTLISIATIIIQRKFNLDSDFALGNYTLTMNISALTLNSDGHMVLRALICALVYGVVAYVVSLIRVSKRDLG
ncbi:MAG: hypothetical protein MJ094_00115 [Saccharofermentans sp.]|nr:hypothetical protein [Saccharofermentans sp.]